MAKAAGVVTQLNNFHTRDAGFDGHGQVCVGQLRGQGIGTRTACDRRGSRAQSQSIVTVGAAHSATQIGGGCRQGRDAGHA